MDSTIFLKNCGVPMLRRKSDWRGYGVGPLHPLDLDAAIDLLPSALGGIWILKGNPWYERLAEIHGLRNGEPALLFD